VTVTSNRPLALTLAAALITAPTATAERNACTLSRGARAQAEQTYTLKCVKVLDPARFNWGAPNLTYGPIEGMVKDFNSAQVRCRFHASRAAENRCMWESGTAVLVRLTPR